jgi:hypothetical protein
MNACNRTDFGIEKRFTGPGEGVSIEFDCR